MQFFAEKKSFFVRFRQAKAPFRQKRNGAEPSLPQQHPLLFRLYFSGRKRLSIQSAAALAPPEARKLAPIFSAFSR